MKERDIMIVAFLILAVSLYLTTKKIQPWAAITLIIAIFIYSIKSKLISK